MKNIIFCADGTWNKPDGGPPTNVYKLYQALVQSDSQTAKYDDGVGTGGLWVERLLGGAFGDGLLQKIKDGYEWIAEIYEDGDRIYLFGFSRGAYTVRSLAGMIAISGLPEADRYTRQAAEDAFAAYRSRDNREALLAALTAKYGNRNVMIDIVGVWDTVGALGIPGGLFANLDQDLYGFLDTNLHPNIKAAYQALAIDERRREFPPSIWNPTSTQGQELEQVWLAGVHSDVGGGYAETALSDIALGWMIKKAAAKGVIFDQSLLRQYTHLDAKGALGEIHTSWDTLWGVPVSRYIPLGSAIADSVTMRLQAPSTYRPANLPKDFPDDLGGMEIEKMSA